MRKVFLYLAGMALVVSCARQKEKIPPAENMEEASGKIIIYQAFTRLFGNTTQVNKPFGTAAENGVGKFNDINDAALTSLRELGATHIWYTGIIEHAVLTDYTAHGIPLDDADVVKGRAGSPYAIKDYYDVNPDLAVSVPDRMKEFEALVDRTHAHGLKVLIDFVPNHVARGYASDAKPAGVKDLGETDDKSFYFSPKNNFYYLPGESFKVPRGYRPLGPHGFPTLDGKFEETPAKVTGNDQFTSSPGVNEWFETVKLNYGVDIREGRQTHFDPIPDTWVKMRDILVFWANKKVDGFRCDMAEMVPVEFWRWVIPQIKSVNPAIVFIAEIYNPDQYANYINTGRFDFLYDKVLLYDTLRHLLAGRRSTADIHTVQQRLAPINAHMLHFVENHDEQRLASKFFAGDPWKGIPVMMVSATIDKGPVMIYFGQEVGEPGLEDEGFQGDDGRTTIFDYWGVPEHQRWVNGGRYDGGLLTPEQRQLRQFYSDLLNLVKKNPAFTQGDYYDITRYNQEAGNFGNDVHAFIRHAGAEKFLVVTSYNSETKTVKIKIPGDVAGQMGLDLNETYIARDVIWREAEVGFDKNLTFSLVLRPYSAFIFKMK
ncbi:MAG TPA: alpha-amylase family protein [Ohtaekwangia sp.]|nr:alpha-amylase family protein [Ohtaekwangia sp.]